MFIEAFPAKNYCDRPPKCVQNKIWAPAHSFSRLSSLYTFEEAIVASSNLPWFLAENN